MEDSVIHHLGIGLARPQEAVEYFERLLAGYLGMEREPTQEAIAGWRGRNARIYLYPTQRGTVPGALQHLAFRARSRGEVDAFPAWAVRAGLVITMAPRNFPTYGPGYYATFFAGPEDLRFELVYFPDDPTTLSPRVRRWQAAWEARDAARVAALYDQRATHTSPRVAQLIPEVGGTTVHGRAAIQEYVDRALATRRELRFEIVALTETETRSVVEYRRHADGAPVSHVVEVLEWDGGRLLATRVFHA